MPLTYKQKFNRKYGQPLNQSNSLRDIAKKTGYSLSGLKTIQKKGEGAFFSNPSSVRKSVKSPSQWGKARIYSAVMKGDAHKFDKSHLIRK